MDALQAQVDELEEKLRKEKAEHNDTKEELEDLKNKVLYITVSLSAAIIHLANFCLSHTLAHIYIFSASLELCIHSFKVIGWVRPMSSYCVV